MSPTRYLQLGVVQQVVLQEGPQRVLLEAVLELAHDAQAVLEAQVLDALRAHGRAVRAVRLVH